MPATTSLLICATALALASATVPGTDNRTSAAALQEEARRTAAGRQLPPHDAFGFRLGEQRRYTMGPEDALDPGELELWTLRLEEVSRDADGMPLYTFHYSYEFVRDSTGSDGRDSYFGQATVTVNQYGFPLEIEYGANRVNGLDTGGTGHNGRVSWANDRFFVERPEHLGGSGFTLDLPNHDELDPSIPTGLFISESDNPALITFPAAIFQATVVTEMEYLSLRPQRIGAGRGSNLRRGGGMGRGGGGRGGAGRGGMGRGRRGRGGGGGSVERAKLEFEAVEEIDVGGRTYEAIRIDSTETDGDVYIRNDGALLRIDTTRGMRRVQIRLLHPSEY